MKKQMSRKSRQIQKLRKGKREKGTQLLNWIELTGRSEGLTLQSNKWKAVVGKKINQKNNIGKPDINPRIYEKLTCMQQSWCFSLGEKGVLFIKWMHISAYYLKENIVELLSYNICINKSQI